MESATVSPLFEMPSLDGCRYPHELPWSDKATQGASRDKLFSETTTLDDWDVLTLDVSRIPLSGP
jgi:hypothetical protein